MTGRKSLIPRTVLFASFALSVVFGCAREDESQASVTGTLVQSIGHARDGSTLTAYHVKAEKGWIRLQADRSLLESQRPNRRVTATGKWADNGRTLVVDALEPETNAEGTVTQALSSTAPPGRVAIFLVKDQTLTQDPFSRQDVQNTIFQGATSSNAYYQELSYGTFGLSGDIYGWYTADLSTCDTYNVAAQAQQQAAARDGFVTDNYRHAITILRRANGDTCNGPLAFGTLGAPDGTGEVWSFLNDSNTVAHELGHNLGLHHANSYICLNTADRYISSGANCTSNEYYDPYDGMASQENYFHFNSYSKWLLGWLPAANQQRVTAPGQFTLVPQEISASGLQSLLVPIPNSNQALHVEMRKQYGFDSLARFDQAVLVRKVYEPGLHVPTHLLDLSPDSVMIDATMHVGQVFQDPLSGIVITLVSRDANHAVVSVAFNGPTCSDGVKNGGETGVDCGNICAPCADGQGCAINEDCTSGVCSGGQCGQSSGCTVQSAVDLGPRHSPITVANNACVMVRQYPSWWQWTNGLVTLQSGTGTFPVPATWSDACTAVSGNFTFTTAWQSQPIGNHTAGCPALIQLTGTGGGPVQITWW